MMKAVEIGEPGGPEALRIAGLPGGIERPRHEQPNQQQARDDPREEQPPDRGLGGDAIDDHCDRGRDQNAKGATCGDGASRDTIGE